ncbi:MAG: hypothetical protein QM737_22605 [Ferruginibacter sp.]
MLVLNKNQSQSNIFPTITTEYAYAGTVPYLQVFHKASKIKYDLLLGENFSQYTNRYDHFVIFQDQYINWEEGEYQYIIWEYNAVDDELVTPLEKGLLTVLGSDPSAYRSLDEIDQPTEEFKVYKGI